MKHILVSIAIALSFLALLGAVYESKNDAIDMATLKSLGTGAMLYCSDADEVMIPAGLTCTNAEGTQLAECPQYYNENELLSVGKDLDTRSRSSWYWLYTMAPYLKSTALFNPNNTQAFWPGKKEDSHRFEAPDAKGINVGGQNSYGYNALYMSPWVDWAGSSYKLTSPTHLSQIERQSRTLVFANASYYLVVPDVYNEARIRKTATNEEGVSLESAWNGNERAFLDAQKEASSQAWRPWQSQGSQGGTTVLRADCYSDYWKNLGGSDWSAGFAQRSGGLNPEHALRKIGALNEDGMVHGITADGHAVQLLPARAVADICYWTTDRDGLHPKCPR